MDLHLSGTGHRARLWSPRATPREGAEGTEPSTWDRQTAVELKYHRDTGRCPQGHMWMPNTEGGTAG